LSGNRFLRELFWHFADAGPWLFAGLLALLCVARWRHATMAALAISLACAVAVAAIFHVNYAIPIWEGHDSAIRSLDRSALSAGFAAGAVAVLLVVAARRAMRLVRRHE
jgi:hypothetical protein